MHIIFEEEEWSEHEWSDGLKFYPGEKKVVKLEVGPLKCDRRFYITEIGDKFIKIRRSEGSHGSYGTFGDTNPLDKKDTLHYGPEEVLELGKRASVSSSWSYNGSTHGESSTIKLTEEPLIYKVWTKLKASHEDEVIYFDRDELKEGIMLYQLRPNLPDGRYIPWLEHSVKKIEDDCITLDDYSDIKRFSPRNIKHLPEYSYLDVNFSLDGIKTIVSGSNSDNEIVETGTVEDPNA